MGPGGRPPCERPADAVEFRFGPPGAAIENGKDHLFACHFQAQGDVAAGVAAGVLDEVGNGSAQRDGADQQRFGGMQVERETATVLPGIFLNYRCCQFGRVAPLQCFVAADAGEVDELADDGIGGIVRRSKVLILTARRTNWPTWAVMA